jgi:hypothetical protein
VDRRITPADLAERALALRRAGGTYRAISDALNLSGPGRAWKLVDRALRDFIEEPAESVRALALARLDDMLLAIWPLARKGHLGAVDRVLKIEERRAKLLGLDAPVKSEVGGAMVVETTTTRRRSQEEIDRHILAIVRSAEEREQQRQDLPLADPLPFGKPSTNGHTPSSS